MSEKVVHSSTVESPCIRNCCLREDDICLGCFRHIDEIVAWQSLSVEKKNQVLNRCKQRKLLSTQATGNESLYSRNING